MSFHPSEPSVQVQTTPFYYTFTKAANTIGYFALLYLTFRFLDHGFSWEFATGCLIISGCWLALTRIKAEHLLQTYFDVLSRIEMALPIAMGTTLSVLAIFAHDTPTYKVIACIEVIGWLYIYGIYKRNREKFVKQGYGPVPEGTWISPPPAVLQPGDLLLTSGNVAKGLHESVGHAEMVLKDPEGKLVLFSSYMGRGAIIHRMEAVTDEKEHGHYIAMRPHVRWNEEQQQKAYKRASEMVELSHQWAERRNSQIKHIIDFFPLPGAAKDKLKSYVQLRGYDWVGTFMGRVAKDHWTCIGACVQLYHEMGVKTNPYGTGLLGFGTTLFDPIMPVRFLADPAFELLKEEPGAVHGMQEAPAGKSPARH